MSGLNQRFTKPSGDKTPREFESHILRKITSGTPRLYFAQCKTRSVATVIASARSWIYPPP